MRESHLFKPDTPPLVAFNSIIGTLALFNAGVKPATCVVAMIAVNNANFIAFISASGRVWWRLE